MLLDLGRNDVGRVSKTGTVKVTEKMLVEFIVMLCILFQMLKEKLNLKIYLNTLMSGFPAGTVSGAPKIRAVINDLE